MPCSKPDESSLRVLIPQLTAGYTCDFLNSHEFMPLAGSRLEQFSPLYKCISFASSFHNSFDLISPIFSPEGKVTPSTGRALLDETPTTSQIVETLDKTKDRLSLALSQACTCGQYQHMMVVSTSPPYITGVNTANSTTALPFDMP